MFATNELFKTEKQPGIKAVDPEVLLGVTRKLSEKNGVRYVTLGQVAYIEQMWEDWSQFRKANGSHLHLCLHKETCCRLRWMSTSSLSV